MRDSLLVYPVSDELVKYSSNYFLQDSFPSAPVFSAAEFREDDSAIFERDERFPHESAVWDHIEATEAPRSEFRLCELGGTGVLLPLPFVKGTDELSDGRRIRVSGSGRYFEVLLSALEGEFIRSDFDGKSGERYRDDIIAGHFESGNNYLTIGVGDIRAMFRDYFLIRAEFTPGQKDLDKLIIKYGVGMRQGNQREEAYLQIQKGENGTINRSLNLQRGHRQTVYKIDGSVDFSHGQRDLNTRINYNLTILNLLYVLKGSNPEEVSVQELEGHKKIATTYAN